MTEIILLVYDFRQNGYYDFTGVLKCIHNNGLLGRLLSVAHHLVKNRAEPLLSFRFD